MNNLNFTLVQNNYPTVFKQQTKTGMNFKPTMTNFVGNRLLNSLDLKTFGRIMPFLERINFTDDKHIYQTRRNIDFVYFPETAVFTEYRILEDGKTSETAMIGSEGIVGLAGLVGSKRPDSWTQVLIPGRALRLSLHRLKQEFENDPALRTSLFSYVEFYIEQICQRVICNNHHLIEERFCNWLMMIRQRCQSDFLPLTHEQISRFLGVQRPSISQIAKSLRENGVIDYKRGQIEIQSYRKLKEFACSCSDNSLSESNDIFAFSD